MANDTENLLFAKSPIISIAGILFNTRIPIQYIDTPILEMVKEVATIARQRYTTKIPIYHSDGTLLAIAKGSRLFDPPQGKRYPGVKLRHFPGVTACELDGKTLFEIRRKGAAAISATAELYATEGTFIKWSEDALSGLLRDNAGAFSIQQDEEKLRVVGPGGGTLIMRGGSLTGDIGILIGTPTKPATGGVCICLQ